MIAERVREDWDNVLDFWFPEGRGLDVDPQAHHAHWRWRMQGGADAEIIARFADITERAAQGALDDWAQDPHGRLVALIAVLDQFSRSVWRNDARAFAQDPYAVSLVMRGLSNGDYSRLETPWFQIVFGLPLGHCEGPDHLQRLDQLIGLRQDIAATAPTPLAPIYSGLVSQAGDVRKIIAAFGRHPHRNGVLNRKSTAEEEAYLAKGQFPHMKAFR
ncbi:DUF924 family protein [Pseudorhodobacter aquimaris]|uniref:DUF924 family protein n=1 Tax=Pseudorhodobacter aquimaris TaxID=687412 RepID=UPI00067BBD75|nr:DUF924 family protein [Pseudorhodobacter aquimaris]